MTNHRDALKAAIALRDKGDIGGAIKLFRVALAKQPDQGGAWAALGQLLEDTGELNEAIICFQKAATLKPTRDIISGSLFFALLHARRFDDARSEAQRFMKLVCEQGVPCAPDIREVGRLS
jgi:Flp pilus assembly protein TadD